MTALSALLARDHVVPPHKLDEAIERQVINGGDLETNLLEVGAIAEDTLVAYCAAIHDAQPIARDEIMAAREDAIARIPREVAETQQLVPVRVEGERLVVAAAAPLSKETRETLERLTGLSLDVRITTSFRVAWALWKFYGTELSARLQRLAQRLQGRPSGTMPSVSSSAPSTGGPTAASKLPLVRPSVLRALTAALMEETEDRRDAPPTSEQVVSVSAHGVAQVAQEVVTLETTRARMSAAEQRDEVVSALLDFVHVRVAYVALFMVQGDMARGLDARGEGLDRDSVRRIAVPLDAPGAFRSVWLRGEPMVGPWGTEGTDPVVQADLGRRAVAQVALLPIRIAGRVALIVWADNGPRSMDPSVVNDIVQVCAESARAFERLIVERKRGRGVGVLSDARGTVTLDITRGAIERQEATGPRTVGIPVNATLGASEERWAGTGTSDAGSIAAVGKTTPSAVEWEDSGERGGTRYVYEGKNAVAVDVVGALSAVPLSQHEGSERQDRWNGPGSGYELFEGSREDEPLRLVADIVRTGVLTDEMAARLLGKGERALAAVFQYFPGPVSMDRTDTRVRRSPVGDAGPLLRLVTMFRQNAGPYLVRQLDSSDPERRYFATLCLGEILYSRALQSLTARLFDPDVPTRTLAVETLQAYRKFPEFEQVMRSLRVIVADTTAGSERRRVAASALGDLRDAEAVPALIVALGDADAALSSVAHRALVVLSRQDFGMDIKEWRAWWERAAGHHRIEWLIEALLHDDPTLRHEASEELKRLTGQFLGYYFNLPRREREKAYRRYREWWEREGRNRFAQ